MTVEYAEHILQVDLLQFRYLVDHDLQRREQRLDAIVERRLRHLLRTALFGVVLLGTTVRLQIAGAVLQLVEERDEHLLRVAAIRDLDQQVLAGLERLESVLVQRT